MYLTSFRRGRSQIEQWCENQYPSFIQVVRTPAGDAKQVVDAADARARIWSANEKIARPDEAACNGRNGHHAAQPPSVVSHIGSALALVFVICLLIVYGVLYLTRDGTRS